MRTHARKPIKELAALFGLLTLLIIGFTYGADIAYKYSNPEPVIGGPEKSAPQPQVQKTVEQPAPVRKKTSADLHTVLRQASTAISSSQATLAVYVQPASGSCGVEDGTHLATVKYTDLGTGRTTTYTVEVRVSNCKVVEMELPDEGPLDEQHFSAAKLDQKGQTGFFDNSERYFDLRIDE